MRVAIWFAGLLLLTGAVGAQQSVQIQQWSVHGTTPLQLTLPVAEDTDTVITRSVDGSWQEHDAAVEDGVLQISLSPGQMAGGPLFIVIDPPRWLSLDDDGPPVVVYFSIDGRDVTDQSEVSLGWTGTLPERIVLRIRDDANPIDRGSVEVRTPVGTLKLRDTGVRYLPEGARAGTLIVLPSEIAGLDALTQGRLEMVVDDYAIDDRKTVRAVSWSLAPSAKLEDGSVLMVDSVTSADGWQDWSVVARGEAMSAGDPSTRGVTWLSDEHAGEHWIRWDFPEAREVVGVRLDWAWFETWRTSRNYDVQVRVDGDWLTVLEVRDQQEQPTSEHSFEPVDATGLRVLQHPGGGQAGRHHYMWLANATVLSAE